MKLVNSYERYLSLYIYLLATFIIIFVPLCWADAQDLTYSHPKEQGILPKKLSKAFDPLTGAIDSKQIGGAIGLVARNGEIVFLQSVGKLDDNLPMPTNAIIRLSSITKTITAASVMILRERGALKLDDHLSEYLPEYKNVKVAVSGENGKKDLVPPQRPMTIKDLLTHQSGIASGGNKFWNIYQKAKSVSEFSAMIAELPLEFHPGQKFEYGQMGASYELLAAIVEITTGKKFRDFIKMEILDPLQMNNTFFNVPKSKWDRYSALYAKNENGKLVIDQEGVEHPTTFWSGAGGLRSTIQDYYRFAQCILNDGLLGDVRILSPESLRLMTTNQVKGETWNSETGWGFGVSIQLEETKNSPESVGTYGWSGGTGTKYIVDPVENLIAIIFIPTSPGTPNVSQLKDEFVKKVYSALEISYK